MSTNISPSFTRPTRSQTADSTASPKASPGVLISADPEPPLTRSEVEDKPWKYIDYKTFSRWLASDADFFVVRRFEDLNARVILSLQWEISALERQLDELDNILSRREAPDVNNGSFHWVDEDRKELVRKAKEKLLEYNKFILRHSAIRGHPPASKYEITNIKNWRTTYPRAIDPEEISFIDKVDDLIKVVPISKSPLRNATERFIGLSWNRFFLRTPQRFQDVESDEKPPYYEYDYDPSTTTYYSDKSVDRFFTFVVCSAGLIMLITPLWVLMFVQSPVRQLGVITGFIVLFLGLIQSVTVARPFESLGATAAYSAVLMVFMQMGTQRQ